MQLNDKVIIITGASSGIGAAAAKLFASQGASLVLGARRTDELSQVTQKILDQNGKAVFQAGDVTSEEYAKRLVQLAINTYGRLDGAFNNAGTLGSPAPVSDMQTEDWHSTIATNLDSAFLAAKYQVPELVKNGGSLVYTSSHVGHTVSFPGMSAYAASKAGLIGLSQTLAVELGAQNVRVNSILPGGTNTDMANQFASSPEEKEFVASLHALKRTADPLEIAKAAMFLLSDAASFVTGSAFIVDGGNSVNKV